MRRLLPALLAGLSCSASQAVWIDSDPSVARGGHEVDDGFALVQAFRSPELSVRGVSVVFGNAPLDQAYPIAQEIVKRFGPPDLPVYKGAFRARDLGVETPASAAIADALRNEPLTLLVLGPATNIATVIRRHPELVPRIVRVIAVAGRRPGQKFRTSEEMTPFRDFNFELDPDAFRVLLDTGVPLVLAPWEISSKIWLNEDDLNALSKTDRQLDFLIEPARDWLAVWRRDLKAPGFNPFDTLAAGYAIAPDQFRCDRVAAVIRVLPDDVPQGSASNATKPYLLRQNSGSSGQVLYCYEALPGFKAELLRRVGGQARAH